MITYVMFRTLYVIKLYLYINLTYDLLMLFFFAIFSNSILMVFIMSLFIFNITFCISMCNEYKNGYG